MNYPESSLTLASKEMEERRPSEPQVARRESFGCVVEANPLKESQTPEAVAVKKSKRKERNAFVALATSTEIMENPMTESPLKVTRRKHRKHKSALLNQPPLISLMNPESVSLSVKTLAVPEETKLPPVTVPSVTSAAPIPVPPVVVAAVAPQAPEARPKKKTGKSRKSKAAPGLGLTGAEDPLISAGDSSKAMAALMTPRGTEASSSGPEAAGAKAHLKALSSTSVGGSSIGITELRQRSVSPRVSSAASGMPESAVPASRLEAHSMKPPGLKELDSGEARVPLRDGKLIGAEAPLSAKERNLAAARRQMESLCASGLQGHDDLPGTPRPFSPRPYRLVNKVEAESVKAQAPALLRTKLTESQELAAALRQTLTARDRLSLSKVPTARSRATKPSSIQPLQQPFSVIRQPHSSIIIESPKSRTSPVAAGKRGSPLTSGTLRVQNNSGWGGSSSRPPVSDVLAATSVLTGRRDRISEQVIEMQTRKERGERIKEARATFTSPKLKSGAQSKRVLRPPTTCDLGGLSKSSPTTVLTATAFSNSRGADGRDSARFIRGTPLSLAGITSSAPPPRENRASVLRKLNSRMKLSTEPLQSGTLRLSRSSSKVPYASNRSSVTSVCAEPSLSGRLTQKTTRNTENNAPTSRILTSHSVAAGVNRSYQPVARARQTSEEPPSAARLRRATQASRMNGGGRFLESSKSPRATQPSWRSPQQPVSFAGGATVEGPLGSRKVVSSALREAQLLGKKGQRSGYGTSTDGSRTSSLLPFHELAPLGTESSDYTTATTAPAAMGYAAHTTTPLSLKQVWHLSETAPPCTTERKPHIQADEEALASLDPLVNHTGTNLLYLGPELRNDIHSKSHGKKHSERDLSSGNEKGSSGKEHFQGFAASGADLENGGTAPEAALVDEPRPGEADPHQDVLAEMHHASKAGSENVFEQPPVRAGQSPGVSSSETPDPVGELVVAPMSMEVKQECMSKSPDTAKLTMSDVCSNVSLVNEIGEGSLFRSGQSGASREHANIPPNCIVLNYYQMQQMVGHALSVLSYSTKLRQLSSTSATLGMRGSPKEASSAKVQ